jgi:hypothetical protein
MRGSQNFQGAMFNYVTLADRQGANKPLEGASKTRRSRDIGSRYG